MSISLQKSYYTLMSALKHQVLSPASCCQGRYRFTAKIKDTQKIPETGLT